MAVSDGHGLLVVFEHLEVGGFGGILDDGTVLAERDDVPAPHREDGAEEGLVVHLNAVVVEGVLLQRVELFLRDRSDALGAGIGELDREAAVSEPGRDVAEDVCGEDERDRGGRYLGLEKVILNGPGTVKAAQELVA